MILVDANLVLYAYHQQSRDHEAAKQWLEAALSGSELVRFPWLTIWAFLRIATNPRVFEQPLSAAEASDAVDSWLAQPIAGVLEPAEHYWQILQNLLRGYQVTGALVTDAAIAALAIEHGATLHTTDRDFSRFDGLRWRNPLTAG
ncbi:MAG: PIN domain nuclease [Proteobacteria bacterium]|nr:MAG: PIN domain nuclease [Pseudomonadota bacterium]